MGCEKIEDYWPLVVEESDALKSMGLYLDQRDYVGALIRNELFAYLSYLHELASKKTDDFLDDEITQQLCLLREECLSEINKLNFSIITADGLSLTTNLRSHLSLQTLRADYVAGKNLDRIMTQLQCLHALGHYCELAHFIEELSCKLQHKQIKLSRLREHLEKDKFELEKLIEIPEQSKVIVKQLTKRIDLADKKIKEYEKALTIWLNDQRNILKSIMTNKDLTQYEFKEKWFNFLESVNERLSESISIEFNTKYLGAINKEIVRENLNPIIQNKKANKLKRNRSVPVRSILLTGGLVLFCLIATPAFMEFRDGALFDAFRRPASANPKNYWQRASQMQRRTVQSHFEQTLNEIKEHPFFKRYLPLNEMAYVLQARNGKELQTRLKGLVQRIDNKSIVEDIRNQLKAEGRHPIDFTANREKKIAYFKMNQTYLQTLRRLYGAKSDMTINGQFPPEEKINVFVKDDTIEMSFDALCSSKGTFEVMPKIIFPLDMSLSMTIVFSIKTFRELIAKRGECSLD